MSYTGGVLFRSLSDAFVVTWFFLFGGVSDASNDLKSIGSCSSGSVSSNLDLKKR